MRPGEGSETRSAASPVQLANANSMTAYPFEDDSVPDGFPLDAVVDLCVSVPGDGRVSLGCLYIGPELASVSIVVGGSVKLLASVPRSGFEEYAPVAMKSLEPGVSGFVTFGAVEFGPPRMFRDAVPVSESAVMRHPAPGVVRFFKSGFDGEATGTVELKLPDAVSASVDNDGDGGRSIVMFTSGRDVLKLFPAVCMGGYVPVPAKTLNGIRPDDDGRVAIVFSHGGTQ